jgi:hypothetical protein
MHTSFYSDNLKGRDHFGSLGIDERIILIDLREMGHNDVGKFS